MSVPKSRIKRSAIWIIENNTLNILVSISEHTDTFFQPEHRSRAGRQRSATFGMKRIQYCRKLRFLSYCGRIEVWKDKRTSLEALSCFVECSIDFVSKKFWFTRSSFQCFNNLFDFDICSSVVFLRDIWLTNLLLLAVHQLRTYFG